MGRLTAHWKGRERPRCADGLVRWVVIRAIAGKPDEVDAERLRRGLVPSRLRSSAGGG